MSLLEQAVIDAATLKEAAMKNAESIILEKYSNELKEAVDSILSQDDEMPNQDPSMQGQQMPGMDPSMMGGVLPAEDPLAQNIPMAATDNEKLCSCPDEDEEIEIDFNQLSQQANNDGQNDLTGSPNDQSAMDQLPGQMDMPAEEENSLFESPNTDGIELPQELGPKLHMYHMSMNDPIYQAGSLISAGQKVPRDLIEQVITSLGEASQHLQDPHQKQDVDGIIETINSTSNIGGNDNNSDLAQFKPDDRNPHDETDDNNAFSDDYDLEENFINRMLEALQVEMDVVPHGHAGHATSSEKDEAQQVALASMQDDDAKKNVQEGFGNNVRPTNSVYQASKEPIAKNNDNKYQFGNSNLQESFNKIQNEYKNLNLEYNKLKNLALSASQKLETLNLFNAKLLYENRALKSDSLNERQKETFVEAISKVGSVNEAKMLYETVQKNTNFQVDKKLKTLNEVLSVRPNVLSIKPQKETKNHSEPEKQRMQKLAGIKRNT